MTYNDYNLLNFDFPATSGDPVRIKVTSDFDIIQEKVRKLGVVQINTTFMNTPISFKILAAVQVNGGVTGSVTVPYQVGTVSHLDIIIRTVWDNDEVYLEASVTLKV